ncbi:unnamed protein product [Closterium sp. NIES-54]
MASLHVLTFNHEGRPIQFNTWLDDLHLYLLSDSRDSVSLFDHTYGASLAPPATADSATRSQWLTRNAAPRLAIRNHLPLPQAPHPQNEALGAAPRAAPKPTATSTGTQPPLEQPPLDPEQPPLAPEAAAPGAAAPGPCSSRPSSSRPWTPSSRPWPLKQPPLVQPPLVQPPLDPVQPPAERRPCSPGERLLYPTLVSTCLVSALPRHLPACQPACLPVCLLACQPACLPACLPVYLSACLPACLPVCLLRLLY